MTPDDGGNLIDVTAAPVGYRVLVEGGGSGAQAWARVDVVDELRPHLCKVIYEHSGAAAWIARKRIRANYVPRGPVEERNDIPGIVRERIGDE